MSPPAPAPTTIACPARGLGAVHFRLKLRDVNGAGFAKRAIECEATEDFNWFELRDTAMMHRVAAAKTARA
eukprot:CAMPEP_0167783476 /NCGR_PEP_ID=MMETSP0111_2-20121227/7093_1 /TAXON_ID=91324 /ORGANISM="Lotharella globosa, Strain CCCM811" /LENGTH=70 /DNA_ID=CAMNT_0007674421 /DNA_START=600 /DNA_END=812 /DNA_ORIENTATION=+